MTILDKINSPSDLKLLDSKYYKELCAEIREFLIKNVLETGGHLASNLGVVELTVALHLAFDCPNDKFIFDVGHQSYIHKMLTERKDEFSTLRKLGGLAGFPKTSESKYDCFNTGHASTSISAALGLARARDLSGGDNSIVAVIGDGSIGGGMAFEALNDAGASNTKLIIVLNDNEMSIEKNVGGLSEYLSKIRMKPKYTNTKNNVWNFLSSKGQVGENIAKKLKFTKDKIKYATISGSLFEQLGLTYMGIIDGHDINKMVEAFKIAKDFDSPVLIHIFTKKGLGYPDAEQSPGKFHGVSKNANSNTVKKLHYSEAFGDILDNIAEKNKKCTAIVAAMKDGCGLAKFEKNHKDRFFDVGIAEQHAVTMAAGMAMGGMTPVVAIYSTFLQRAYDQILHDVCMQNLHVVFAIDRAGIVGEDGETHHGTFDISYLSQMPNMTVLAPSCYDELKMMLDYAINKHTGPIAIRFPRSEAEIRDVKYDFSPSKAEILKEGTDVAIICVGAMVKTGMDVAKKLENNGVYAAVINPLTIKPFDEKTISEYANKTRFLVTIEDNIKNGGFGALINSHFKNSNVKILNFAYDDEFIAHGERNELIKMCGMDVESIVSKILKEREA